MKGITGRERHSAETLKRRNPRLFRKLVAASRHGSGMKQLGESDRDDLQLRGLLTDGGSVNDNTRRMLDDIGIESEPRR